MEFRPLFVLFSLCLMASLLMDVDATCCHRKPTLGCCGVGSCNIFCCNCAGGCDEQCETSTCSATDWLKCAVTVGKCGATCVSDPPTCVSCMGPLYSDCFHCIGLKASDTFMAIDRDGDGGLNPDEFDAYMAENNVTRDGSDECENHDAWDESHNGKISPNEFELSRCGLKHYASTDPQEASCGKKFKKP